MLRILACTMAVALLSGTAQAAELPKRFADEVRALHDRGQTPWVRRGGTNEYLGFLLIDVVTGDRLGRSVEYSPEKRIYRGASVSGDKVTWNQQSNRKGFEVNYFVEVNSCATGHLAPTSKRVKIRDAVGNPGSQSTDIIKAYAGVSTLSLEQKADGRIMATVFIEAEDHSWDINLFHLRENYSFEVRATEGSWERFMAGDAARFEPTAQGIRDYQAGVKRMARYLGSRAASFAKTAVSQFDIYMDSLDAALEYIGNPAIEGSKDGKMTMTHSALALKVTGITTWTFADGASGCAGAKVVD